MGRAFQRPFRLLALLHPPSFALQELYEALTEKGIDCSGWSPAMAMNAVVYKTREMRDEQAIVRALQQAQKEMGPPQIVFVLQEHGKCGLLHAIMVAGVSRSVQAASCSTQDGDAGLPHTHLTLLSPAIPSILADREPGVQ